MKLTRDLSFITKNLGGYLFTDKELESNISNELIAEKLTNFFIKSNTNLIENYGFEYTYPQLNQIKKLLKTDKDFILNVINDQFNPLNGDKLITEYKRYLKSVKGEYDHKMILQTPYKGDDILEQISNEDSVNQVYEGKVIQSAGDFSKQISGGESSQSVGNYSIQITANHSYQSAGNYATQLAGEYTEEQISGHYSSQRTGSNSFSETGDNSEQQTTDNSILECGNKCNQIAENENSLRSGDKCNIDALDFNKITTGMYSVMEIDSHNIVITDDYCTVKANDSNTINVGESSMVNVRDFNTIKVKGGNLKLKCGMNNTIMLSSINGFKQYHSNEDFPDFSEVEFVDGILQDKHY